MKIKIEVDDRDINKARDMTAEILCDLLAKYPKAEANLANRDFKNSVEIRV